MSNKYALLPVKYPELWESYKLQEHAFWTAEELDLTVDLDDWRNKLNDGERFYIKRILAFFAQSDGIVNENLAARFYIDCEIPEARAFYSAQMFIETVHAEVYALLIDTYVQDDKEKDLLFDAIANYPTIAKKAEWALKWLNSDKSFAHRLFAFAVVEGLFFSGAFCSIFWLRKRGLMHGLAEANTLIARDEGLHWQFAPKVYKNMFLSLSKEEMHKIMDEAVGIEVEFIREALPVKLIGMNADLMEDYIKYTADRVLYAFNSPPLFETKNPFDFMNLIDLEGKANFFERRSTAYAKVKDNAMRFDVEF